MFKINESHCMRYWMMHFYPNKRVITQKRMVLLVVKAVSLRFLSLYNNDISVGLGQFSMIYCRTFIGFNSFSIQPWNAGTDENAKKYRVQQTTSYNHMVQVITSHYVTISLMSTAFVCFKKEHPFHIKIKMRSY